jgi:hypothetical protein
MSVFLLKPTAIGERSAMIWVADHRIWCLVQWESNSPHMTEAEYGFCGVTVIDRKGVVVGADSLTLGLSYWLLTCLSAVLPVLWVRRFRRMRYPAGMCPRCGYDLRATPEQCPECGRKIVGQPAAS